MLTALDTHERVVDLTREEDWKRVWRTRVHTACRECREQVWAKKSHLGTRFIAHAQATDCASGGESDAHNHLKRAIADAARSDGWVVDVEASPGPDDHEDWRADLLVSHPGRDSRLAVEVQLSPQTEGETRMRTERYGRDEIATLWVSTTAPHWRGAAPWGLVEDGDDLVLHDCHYVLAEGVAGGLTSYRFVDSHQPIRHVIGALIDGALVHHHEQSLPSGGLVSREDRDRAEHLQRIIFDERQERERLRQQQGGLVGPAVTAALEVAGTDERVWVGARPVPVNDEGASVLTDIDGDRFNALGVPVWRGKDRKALRPFAMLAPMPRLIDTAVARSWADSGVRVLTSTPEDRAALVEALGTDGAAVLLVEPSHYTPITQKSPFAPSASHFQRHADHQHQLALWARANSLTVGSTAGASRAHGIPLWRPSGSGAMLSAVAMPHALSVVPQMREDWASRGIRLIAESSDRALSLVGMGFRRDLIVVMRPTGTTT